MPDEAVENGHSADRTAGGTQLGTSGNTVDNRVETVFTEDMTTDTKRVVATSTSVQVLVKDGLVDFDNNEEASQEFVDAVSATIEGGIHAAWNALVERFPEADITISIDGFEFGARHDAMQHDDCAECGTSWS